MANDDGDDDNLTVGRERERFSPIRSLFQKKGVCLFLSICICICIHSTMPSTISCFQYCCTEDELDGDGLCFDSNSIVEITLQRDYLLLKLQELVDCKTPSQANKAVGCMEDACRDDDSLFRFLIRAGTIPILQDVVTRVDDKAGWPASSLSLSSSSSTSQVVVSTSLLRKLVHYQEASIQQAAERRHRPNWTWVGVGGWIGKYDES